MRFNTPLEVYIMILSLKGNRVSFLARSNSKFKILRGKLPIISKFKKSNLSRFSEMNGSSSLFLFKTVSKRNKVPRMVKIVSSVREFHVSVSISIIILVSNEVVMRGSVSYFGICKEQG